MSDGINPNDFNIKQILIGNPHCFKCGKLTNWGELWATDFRICAKCVLELASTPEEKPEEEKPKVKSCYVGAPAIFALETACRQLNEAFDSYGVYLVGSSLVKKDWRDVDLRMIMEDKKFYDLFPDAHGNGSWEFDSRWLLLTVSISEHLSKITGLPIDFQFQPQSHANKYHPGERQAIGLRMEKRSVTEARVKDGG